MDEVIKLNPDTQIVVLSAFSGVHVLQLKAFVDEYNKEKMMDIKFIDSSGWIPLKPRHPLRDGHRVVAKHLVEELRKLGISE